MGFPTECYCFRNGCRWLLIGLILGHYRRDGNQRGPVGFWVNKQLLASWQSGTQRWRVGESLPLWCVVRGWTVCALAEGTRGGTAHPPYQSKRWNA